MLILTRKVDDSIMIGDDIKVTVLQVTGQTVRIGIAAPKNVSVDREEVRQRKDSNPHYYDDKLAGKQKNGNR